MYVVRFGRQKPYFELRESNKLALKNVPVHPTDFWDDGIFHQVAFPYASLFQTPTERRSRIFHWLAKNSDLARFFYTVIRANSPRVFTEPRQALQKSDDAESLQAHTVMSSGSELTPAEQMQIRLLGDLVEQLAEHIGCARFLVVLSGQLIPLYRPQIEKFRASGIVYLDATTQVLAERFKDSEDKIYYRYSKHWTPAAHRVVAEMIAEVIRDKGLCTPPGHLVRNSIQ